MAIAFDATSQGETAAGTSVTVSHTVTGANPLLLVAAETFQSGGAEEPTATYNGVGMTQNGTSAGSNQRNTALYIVGVTGTHDIVVSISPSQELTVLADSFSGVDQGTPVDAAVTETEAGVLTTTFDVSSASGDLVWDTVNPFNPNTPTVTGGTQTALSANNNGAGNNSLLTSTAPGAATVTMGWQIITTARNFDHIAMNINAAAGGGRVTKNTRASGFGMELGMNLWGQV